MKTKNNFFMEHIAYIMQSFYFKLSVVFFILFSIFSGTYGREMDYLSAFISILTEPRYFSLGILVVVLFNTINVYTLFEKNRFMISRLQDKRHYLLELLKTVFVINCILFLIMLLSVTIGIHCYTGIDVRLFYNSFFQCSILVYFFYTLVKVFLLIQLISFFNVLLLKKINQSVVLGGNLLLYATSYFAFYDNTRLIKSLFEMPLIITDYFQILHYQSFSMEVGCFVLFFGLLVFLFLWSFRFVLGRMERICE